MSNTSTIDDSGRISGQKMSFSQACNLLSNYVKEKRALGISGNMDNRGMDYYLDLTSFTANFEFNF